MPLEFAPQCCDSMNYVELGRECASNIGACWHGFRPVGALLYFSIPFRLGLPAEAIIFLNALLVLISAALATVALFDAFRIRTRLSRSLMAGVSLGVHVWFMAGTVRNSLSDGPAAVLALVFAWSFVLASVHRRTWLYVVAGMALGLATIVRISFLYPALLAAVSAALLLHFRGEPRVRIASFLLPIALPIAVQIGATYAALGSLTFIEPASFTSGEWLHFETDMYGYDVVRSAAYGYHAPECLGRSGTFGEALRTHDLRGLTCIVSLKQWYYFGSFTPFGRVYLDTPNERHFSVAYLLANAATVIFSIIWAARQSRRFHLLLVPLVFMLAVWGEAFMLVPESRFLMSFQVFVWTVGLAGVVDVSLSAARGAATSSEEGFAWIKPAIAEHIERPLGRAWAAFIAHPPWRRPALLPPALAILATLIVQSMALNSGFRGEDFRNLYETQELDPFKFLVDPYGGHFCAFFRFCIAALHSFFGVHAVAFFGLMLATHVLHVLLLYGIVRVLSGSRAGAALAAGLWGAMPAFQGTLQSFAAFSHVLAATAVLYPLWELSRAREARRPPSTASIVRISVAIFLGAGTAMTGSLTGALFPLLAFAFLPKESAPFRTGLRLLPAAFLSTAVVLALTGKAIAGALVSFHLGRALLVFAELWVYGVALFIAGPLATITRDNVSWLAGAPFGGVVVASLVLFLPVFGMVALRLVRGDWDERRALLAALGLSGALYAAVAVGHSGITVGQALPGIAFQDRYHYGAGIGLVIAMSLAVARTFPSLRWPAIGRQRVLLSAFAAIWSAAAFLAAKSTYLQGGTLQEWTTDYTKLTDGSLRLLLARVPPWKTLYVRNDPFAQGAMQYSMGVSYEALPGIGSFWIAAHGTEPLQLRRIRFVEMDPEALRRIRARSRRDVGKMFVSPRQVAKAKGQIRAIDTDGPPEIARFLSQSITARLVPYNHRRADDLLRQLHDAETRAPLPFGPAKIPLPPEDPPPPLTDEQKAAEALRKRLEADPKAAEAFRQSILKDPKAIAEIRRAIQEQIRQEKEDE